MPPQVVDNRRVTERADGIELLFGAAQDLARQQGKLNQRIQACPQNSGLEHGLFKLRSTRNSLIVALPIQEVREMLYERRKLACQVIESAGIEINAANPPNLERQKVRVQTVDVRALAWAIGHGKRVPYCRKRRWAALEAVVLLLCGVVPGLIYLSWQANRRRRYRRELAELVKRWRAAGQPESPGELLPALRTPASVRPAASASGSTSFGSGTA